MEDFGSGKVIVLLGARQVGKTTLLEALREKGGKTLMLNCDDVSDRLLLEGRSSTELRALVEGYDTVFMDEVQRVRNIGLTLKMIGDLKLNTQVIATGSSSLDLADEIHEPATGRLIEYQLFPFSLGELAAETSEREEGRMLEQRMVYGLYPEVVMNPGQADLRFYARDGEERGAGDLFCAVEEGLRLIHQEYPAVILFPGKAEKFEPYNDDRISIWKAFDQKDLFVVENIRGDLNPFHIRHLSHLLSVAFQGRL